MPQAGQCILAPSSFPLRGAEGPVVLGCARTNRDGRGPKCPSPRGGELASRGSAPSPATWAHPDLSRQGPRLHEWVRSGHKELVSRQIGSFSQIFRSSQQFKSPVPLDLNLHR